MKTIGHNWKTSLFGFLVILCGMYIGVKSSNWELATPVVLAGAGLIAAKDGVNNENNL